MAISRQSSKIFLIFLVTILFSAQKSAVHSVVPVTVHLRSRNPANNSRTDGFNLTGTVQQNDTQLACRSYNSSTCPVDLTLCSCDFSHLSDKALAIDARSIVIGEKSGNIICAETCPLGTLRSLPSRSNLTSVRLVSVWLDSEENPFPVGDFLANVKAILTTLELVKIYIPSITRQTFAGFAALERLQLHDNRLSTIADAFVALDEGLKFPARKAWTPKLRTVDISYNKVPLIDWSIFQPLNRSIKEIFLIDDQIQIIFLSPEHRPFVLHNVETVQLCGSKLFSLDNRFLRSIASSRGRPYLNLDRNIFCVTNNQCRCSELTNLWVWLKKRPLGHTHPSTAQNNVDSGDVVTCGNFTSGTVEDVNLTTRWEDIQRGRRYRGSYVTALATCNRRTVRTPAKFLACFVERATTAVRRDAPEIVDVKQLNLTGNVSLAP
ncbi:uncharacterized protein LOC129601466 [Paramacrobiotus metropolitanus]|uniref:uncharacterized protein LOC129601466 n=1 Tax=Paramacrobiotus metropolitanus TaxID=2943436 RepID=UPI0024464B25|nr:uncharacterized protein LOC129601466 [Paramacrobiotus metropolitanus]